MAVEALAVEGFMTPLKSAGKELRTDLRWETQPYCILCSKNVVGIRFVAFCHILRGSRGHGQ